MDNAQKAIMIGVGLFITIIIISAVLLILSFKLAWTVAVADKRPVLASFVVVAEVIFKYSNSYWLIVSLIV